MCTFFCFGRAGVDTLEIMVYGLQIDHEVIGRLSVAPGNSRHKSTEFLKPEARMGSICPAFRHPAKHIRGGFGDSWTPRGPFARRASFPTENFPATKWPGSKRTGIGQHSLRAGGRGGLPQNAGSRSLLRRGPVRYENTQPSTPKTVFQRVENTPESVTLF